MKQCCSELGAHPLTERELADRLGQQGFESQHGDELVTPMTIAIGRYSIDVGQEIETVEDGQVPPELAALAENHTDTGHVPEAIFVGDKASHFDPPAGRPENP